MDGAGRLAATLRPRADLKAAAIGAVILLRERLGFAHTRRAGRPAKAPAREIERKPPQQVGVAATVLLLLGSAGFGIVRGGHLDDLTAAFSDTRNALASS